MRRIILPLVLSAGLLCSGALAEENSYTPGTYSADVFGMLDDVNVTVTFDGSSIVSVEASGQETEGIGTKAIEQLPSLIVAAQSAEVEAVSGATVTSEAIKNAVRSCMAQAKGEQTASEEAVRTEADVIVIGAGAAGLAAAAGAGEQGASVIVLEANGRVGGSASTSGGHMTMIDDALNASMARNDADLAKYDALKAEDFGEWGEALTVLQAQIADYRSTTEEVRFDSVERTLVDHYLSASGKDLDGQAATLDYALVKEAVLANMDVTRWLMTGGMQVEEKYYKDHANTPIGKGTGMIEAELQLATQANADIQYGVRAVRLVTDAQNAVTGVVAVDANGNERTYTARGGVVVATGSFSSNGEMAAQYQRIGAGLNAENGSTNPATNLGDGITMAQAVGAQLRDMQFMTTMVFGYHGGCSYMDWGKFNGKQQLTVNADAVRYYDETKNNPLTHQPGGLTYLVGDSKMAEALSGVGENFLEQMIASGVVVKADTLAEAAVLAGLDADTLAGTVEGFNSAVDANSDEAFGRALFNGKLEQAPYIIARGEAFYHLTFGGLVTDTDARVLDANGKPIEKLYAAGDVTTGIEGANHQSGACLTAAIYYGKKAGELSAQGR